MFCFLFLWLLVFVSFFPSKVSFPVIVFVNIGLQCMQTLNKRLEDVITCINTRASSLAKLLVVSASALIFVILWLQLGLEYSVAVQRLRPILISSRQLGFYAWQLNLRPLRYQQIKVGMVIIPEQKQVQHLLRLHRADIPSTRIVSCLSIVVTVGYHWISLWQHRQRRDWLWPVYPLHGLHSWFPAHICMKLFVSQEKLTVKLTATLMNKQIDNQLPYVSVENNCYIN